MANFTEIDEARKILGLSDTATLKEIKEPTERWPITITPTSIVALTVRKQ